MSIFKKAGSIILDTIETIVIALAIFVVIYLFLFQPHQVKGSSMYPNFHDGEYLLTNKISYSFDEPKRGEVIIFRAPQNEQYDYIKRIIGLPGEKVKIENGKVFVNDQKLEEFYLPESLRTQAGRFSKESQTIAVPSGQYFVLGDNRDHSSDSREWGPVPRRNIIGRAWFRYWPPSIAGLISEVEY